MVVAQSPGTSVVNCSAVKLIPRNICILGLVRHGVLGSVGLYLGTCQTYLTSCAYVLYMQN